MNDKPEAGDRRYKKLLENIDDTVTVVDATGATLWTTASIRRDLGYEPGFWEDADLFSLVHPGDSQLIVDRLAELLADPRLVIHDEVRLSSPEGDYVNVRFTAVNLLDDPDIGGIVLTSRSNEAEVAHRKLQAQREAELLALSEAQTDLLTSVSHEMRNPLHAISGLAELLAAEESLNQSAARAVESLGRETDALRRMIDDLLDFSKAAAGRMELDLKPFSPAVVADQSMSAFRVAAAKKDLTLTATISPEVPLTVLGDAFRIRQILMNLLSNAVKYTTDGSVELELSLLANGRLRFSVRDSGPGIPDGAVSTIFDPYEQARRTDSKKGTGLGLAITKNLVELMGGTLQLTSGDTGTHFWCDLQLAEARRASDRAEAAPVGGSGIVLVVDDSDVNQMLSSSQLERLGYTPRTASGGIEALEILASSQIDLVLMDWHMPDLDGLETTRRIRARETETAAARIPIIAVTASAVSGDRERCLDAGMDDYLAKPVSLGDLATMVGRWIGGPEAGSSKGVAARTAPGVDQTRIDELVDELGDRTIVANVVATFLTELPKWQTALVDGVAANDFTTAKRSAHTLKSTASLLGAHGLAATCADFEQAAEENPADAAAMVDRFVQEANDTSTQLSEIHSQLDQAA